jgi:hypothetical protein
VSSFKKRKTGADDRCQVGGDSTWSTQETYSAGCATFVNDG